MVFPPIKAKALKAGLAQIAPVPYPVMQKGPFPSKSLAYNPFCFWSRNQGLQSLSFLPLLSTKILLKRLFSKALQAPYRHSRHHTAFSFSRSIHTPPCCLCFLFPIYISCFLLISSLIIDTSKKTKLEKNLS